MADLKPAVSTSPFLAGFFCRCPNCGKGPLFDGYLTVTEACSTCGENLSAHEQGDGPAVFVIMILGFLVVGLAVFVEFHFHPPIWVHWIIWPPFILVAAMGMLRPLKGLMVGTHFHHRREERERD